MNTLINSKNSVTSDLHRLLLNLTDTINLTRISCLIKPYNLLYVEKYKKLIQK